MDTYIDDTRHHNNGQPQGRDGKGHQNGGQMTKGNIERDNSSGRKRAHFADGHGSGDYRIPNHVYDRYAGMDKQSSDTTDGLASGYSQYPADHTQINLEQVTTLYMPKNKKYDDGTKTLMRRRRTSSKRRSSSKRKHERECVDDLLDDEDNHLLPSLRLQRRGRTKTLKERRSDLEEERGEEGQSFRQRVQALKDQDELTPAQFAELLRDSTLRRVRNIGEWSRPKRKERFGRWMRDVSQHFGLWVTSFKIIEGQHGTAVMSYFKFVRWLMFLNVFLMIIMIGVTTIPFVALKPRDFEATLEDANRTVLHAQANNCSMEYEDYHKQLLEQESVFEKVLDFLQGTGWMERTVLFVGHYHNKTYTDHEGEGHIYNMGLAYLLAVWSAFFISFILLVRSSAKTVKATFGIEGSMSAFTNRVFGGWDFVITSSRAAKTKHRSLFNDFMACIAEEKRKDKIAQRTANDEATLFFIRFMVWGFVIGVLAGAMFLVYFTTVKLLQLQEQDLNEVLALIVQYLPYLTITVLNFLIPIIFQKVVEFEDYSHSVALRVTLFRSILLRLASLIVLIGSLYWLLIFKADPENGLCGNRLWARTLQNKKGSIKCWETYVGQQIYKLVLLDLIVETGIVIFIYLPRKLVYEKFKDNSNIIGKFGAQQFDLPQSVIDIIYSQTLCWLGMFFSPFIPFMTFLKCVIFFYLRKWTVLKICAQTEHYYRTSRSHSLFMFVLLCSFVLTLIPFGYIISSIAPSQSCGPFRVYSSNEFIMFEALSNVVRTWPDALRDILLFLGTAGFIIPVILILIFFMYYNWLLSQGYKRREKLLSEALKMEGKDKLFLLTRVNEVLTIFDGGAI